ncbi:MAG: hypothetical protein QG625_3067 [Cyanobacteriota bacterium erpe_2018_sw_39hr_WHONDRS-SW48-000098_B_bin.30]|nr:hypothetical protein [Cyanobacteriota bacterium erpe_2018_sw_39hr_WHONDRS-SW48-000098_B_bin.30]
MLGYNIINQIKSPHNMQKNCLTALALTVIAWSFYNSPGAQAEKPSVDPYFPKNISTHFNPTVDEIVFHEDRLRTVSDNNVMERLDGGILFDGTMTEQLKPDKYNHNRWKFKIDHVYYPTEGYKKRDLIALTKPGEHGIKLNPGSRYRVYVYDFGKYSRKDLKGPFSLWKGSYITLPGRGR